MRVLIVDDEPLARERLRTLLSAQDDIDRIGEARSGDEALAILSAGGWDLVFLDVQMPGRDGFEVVAALPAEAVPLVIFVTAYERHALRAFDVHAVDYLLKPFDVDRFAVALDRARERLSPAGLNDARAGLLTLLASLGRDRESAAVITVRAGARLVPLRTDEIDWVEAYGNYVRLHVGKDAHLLRRTLSALETTLDPRRFRRIHRSTLVNVDRIRELHSWFRKDYRVILRDGTELTLSRHYAERLSEFLGR